MKVLLALCALVAAANSQFLYMPQYRYMAMKDLKMMEPIKIEPKVLKYAFKPVEKEVDMTARGYVAITRGSKHIAPLPYGLASHHVNMAKAPGTKK